MKRGSHEAMRSLFDKREDRRANAEINKQLDKIIKKFDDQFDDLDRIGFEKDDIDVYNGTWGSYVA